MVLRVSETTITCTPTFKVADVQVYLAGHTPMEIFLIEGFNLDAIGQGKPKSVYCVGGRYLPHKGFSAFGRKRGKNLRFEKRVSFLWRRNLCVPKINQTIRVTRLCLIVASTGDYYRWGGEVETCQL